MDGGEFVKERKMEITTATQKTSTLWSNSTRRWRSRPRASTRTRRSAGVEAVFDDDKKGFYVVAETTEDHGRTDGHL